MKNYMYDLLIKIESDKGKTINYFIDTEVLTKNYIIKKAIETQYPNILYSVALYVKNLNKEDIDKIVDVIIKIDDLEILYEFAANIPNVPLDKIVNKIIEKDESKYLYRLATYIKEKKYFIIKIMNKIINLKDAEYIYLFTRDLLPNLECVDIDRLENAIIRTKDLQYIYEFAKNIKITSIRNLALAIIESENEEYIQKLRKLVNAPEDIESMIEREKLKKQSECEQLSELNALIKLEQPEDIQYNADIYRKLFVETEEEEKEIEKEINHKKKVLKPMFPGIKKL